VLPELEQLLVTSFTSFGRIQEAKAFLQCTNSVVLWCLTEVKCYLPAGVFEIKHFKLTVLSFTIYFSIIGGHADLYKLLSITFCSPLLLCFREYLILILLARKTEYLVLILKQQIEVVTLLFNFSWINSVQILTTSCLCCPGWGKEMLCLITGIALNFSILLFDLYVSFFLWSFYRGLYWSRYAEGFENFFFFFFFFEPHVSFFFIKSFLFI